MGLRTATVYIDGQPFESLSSRTVSETMVHVAASSLPSFPEESLHGSAGHGAARLISHRLLSMSLTAAEVSGSIKSEIASPVSTSVRCLLGGLGELLFACEGI